MSIADELDKLDRLRQSGALTDAEFQQQKAALLKGSDTPSPAPGSPPFPHWKSVPLKNRRWFQGLLMLLVPPVGVPIAVLNRSYTKRRGQIVPVGGLSRAIQIAAALICWVGLIALLATGFKDGDRGAVTAPGAAARDPSAGAPQQDAQTSTTPAEGNAADNAPQFQLQTGEKCNSTQDWDATPNGQSCAPVYRLIVLQADGPVTLQRITLNDRAGCDITNMDVGQPPVRMSDDEKAKLEDGMSDFGKGLVESSTTKAALSVPRVLQVGDSYEFRMPGHTGLPFSGPSTDCGSTLVKVSVFTDRGNFSWDLSGQSQ